jgi:hypothetical protein
VAKRSLSKAGVFAMVAACACPGSNGPTPGEPRINGVVSRQVNLGPVEGQPARPPELFGTVVKTREGVRESTQFLIYCQQPPVGVEESSHNEWERSFPGPHVWVRLTPETPVKQRGRNGAQLAVGQTVSAWCRGAIAVSQPPIWSAELVVIE